MNHEDLPAENEEYPSEIIGQEKYAATGFLIGGAVFFMTSIFIGNIAAIIKIIITGEYTWVDIFTFLLPAASLYCFLNAYYCHLRWQKYGRSIIRLHDKHGLVGRSLKGTLTTQHEVYSAGTYLFTLTCRETKKIKTNKGYRSDIKNIWSESKTVKSQGYRSKNGIPFEIALPSECKGIEEGNEDLLYQWELNVSARTKGINYKTFFYVPVFRNEPMQT